MAECYANWIEAIEAKLGSPPGELTRPEFLKVCSLGVDIVQKIAALHIERRDARAALASEKAAREDAAARAAALHEALFEARKVQHDLPPDETVARWYGEFVASAEEREAQRARADAAEAAREKAEAELAICAAHQRSLYREIDDANACLHNAEARADAAERALGEARELIAEFERWGAAISRAAKAAAAQTNAGEGE